MLENRDISRSRGAFLSGFAESEGVGELGQTGDPPVISEFANRTGSRLSKLPNGEVEGEKGQGEGRRGVDEERVAQGEGGKGG